MSVRSMIRSRAATTAIAAACVAGLAAPAAIAAGSVPLPDQDPFYNVPANISGLANGKILSSRSVTANFYSLPDLANAWQVKYKTIDVHGNPSADVATILMPTIPWTGKGPRPLVSYQTAEDGDGSKCAPSYALRAGASALPGDSEDETGLMELALMRGWALVVPDYEGPRSEFIGASGEAHGVLDGVRAALHFKPSGLSAHAPVALWGYSGGSLASDLAAQAQPTYAPGLKFAGIALGGLVADVGPVFQAFDSLRLGGVEMMGLASINRDYPQYDVLKYLNPSGRKAVAKSQDECIADAAMQFPASFKQYEAKPDSLTQLDSLLRYMSPLYLPGTPTTPIYDYHEVADELAPIGQDREQMARYCAAGVTVDHVELVNGEHLAGAVAGAPDAIAWLASRFAGQRSPNDCASLRKYTFPAQLAPPAPRCTVGQALTLRPRRLHGERIRRITVTWKGHRLATARGRNIRRLRVTHLSPGRYTLVLHIRGTRGNRTVRIARTVSCASS